MNVITLTILKKFDPEPDLCPVNIKLSAYNNSKIPVLGKCSLNLKYKKDHFDVLLIVVDSKSVVFLRWATSESLHLIKRISAVNVTIFIWFLSLFWRDRNSKKYSPYWNQGCLNKAIKGEHLHLSAAEEIFSQMSGASHFSKIDASSGYWQIKVDRVQIYWRLILPQIDIVSKAYLMESILQVKFFRGKLLQLFRTYQAVQIRKTTS